VRRDVARRSHHLISLTFLSPGLKRVSTVIVWNTPSLTRNHKDYERFFNDSPRSFGAYGLLKSIAIA
jgi:hypothetical protein